MLRWASARRVLMKSSAHITLPETVMDLAKKKCVYAIHQGRKEDFVAPPVEVEATRESLLEVYKSMVVARTLEETCQASYKQHKLIRGFLHLYIGQEACAAGIAAAMPHSDPLVTAYRDHVIHYFRGGDLRRFFAEMYGRAAGCSKGKGGSMHLYNVQEHFYGGHGIVGAQVPLGVGLSMAAWFKNRKEPPNVSVAMFGDGASNQGQIFEVYNMAALWQLPVIFVCENNHFGMGTSENRASSNPYFYTRCETIPGIRCDGMDFLAVRTTMAHARNWVAAGRGPVMVEFDTYRYGNHSISDPGTSYRTASDVEKMRESRDCISKLVALMVTNELATREELKKIDEAAWKEVAAAEELARDDPWPEEAELASDIFSHPVPVRGVRREIVYNAAAPVWVRPT